MSMTLISNKTIKPQPISFKADILSVAMDSAYRVCYCKHTAASVGPVINDFLVVIHVLGYLLAFVFF